MLAKHRCTGGWWQLLLVLSPNIARPLRVTLAERSLRCDTSLQVRRDPWRGTAKRVSGLAAGQTRAIICQQKRDPELPLLADAAVKQAAFLRSTHELP